MLGSTLTRLRRALFRRGAAREYGRLHAAIAAIANVHGVPLLIYNVKDFQVIEDLVEVRESPV